MCSSTDIKSVSEVASRVGLNRVLTELLFKRGFDTPEKISDFMNPSLSNLSPITTLDGLDEACKLIEKHKNGKVLVYGDYDCDGIGASAIMYLALNSHGIETEVFIPTRIDDGYGLSVPSLKRAIAMHNPTLLLTVDCGISSCAEVDFAKEVGLDVIVTDHHEPQDVLPDCILVNPKLSPGATEFCGCGVAFMLIRALFGDECASSYLDICAISTIADLVPLTSDNRIIASIGLKKISSGGRDGINALLRVSGHRMGEHVSSGDIAFKIAPRLNASGRLSDAEKSFKLLTSNDMHEIRRIAEDLEKENRLRQELCLSTINDARQMLLDYDLGKYRIIVLENDKWEGGVIGIAAAKIAEEFHRPTILFSKKNDVYKGSCRSIYGVSIYDILQNAKDSLVQFGGHSMAAGLSILPNKVDEFRDIANNYIIATYGDEPFKPSYSSDIVLPVSDVNIEFADMLTKFEPFGMGNPKPVFSALCGRIDVSRIKSTPHLKAKINDETEFIAFNASEKSDVLRSEMRKTIYYTIDKESFRGKETARCTYKDLLLNEILPTETEQILRYADRYLAKPAQERQMRGVRSNDSLFGTLRITWSEETFNKLRKLYPDYFCALGTLPTQNPFNTILIAPKGYYGFEYYGNIVLYDDAPDNYAKKLENSFGATVLRGDICGKIPLFNPPTRNDLAKVFSYIKAFYNGKRFPGKAQGYIDLVKGGYNLGYVYYELALDILTEIGVIYFDGEILRISSEKKELGQSRILKAIGGGNHAC